MKYIWNYDKAKYKERNKIERFFKRLKKRISARYDKLDNLFLSFVCFSAMLYWNL